MPPPQPSTSIIPDFATTQLSLLAAELAAEIEESTVLQALHSPAALQRAGVALANLTVVAQRTGLGGKTVLELGRDPATASSGSTSNSADREGEKGNGGELLLPEHGIRVGDIVLIREYTGSGSGGGGGGKGKGKGKGLDKDGERGGAVKGVVTRVARAFVAVAVEERDGGEDASEVREGERVWIVKVADDVTFRRQVLYPG
jgi:DNA polymerase alpha-associated DNA helicase A